MDDEKRLITLQPHHVIAARLTMVAMQHSDWIEHLFPSFLRHAGAKRLPVGVVTLLQLGMTEYAKNKTNDEREALYEHMERFIKIMVGGEANAAPVLRIWRRQLGHKR